MRFFITITITLRNSFRLRVEAWCKALLNKFWHFQLLSPKTKIMQINSSYVGKWRKQSNLLKIVIE